MLIDSCTTVSVVARPTPSAPPIEVFVGPPKKAQASRSLAAVQPGQPADRASAEAGLPSRPRYFVPAAQPSPARSTIRPDAFAAGFALMVTAPWLSATSTRPAASQRRAIRAKARDSDQNPAAAVRPIATCLSASTT